MSEQSIPPQKPFKPDDKLHFRITMDLVVGENPELLGDGEPDGVTRLVDMSREAAVMAALAPLAEIINTTQATVEQLNSLYDGADHLLEIVEIKNVDMHLTSAD